MSASTGPVSVVAPDDYGQPGKAGYVSCHGAEVVTFQVFNQGIVYQLAEGSPPVFDGQPEVALAPALRSIPARPGGGWAIPARCDAIRFRAQTRAAQLAAGVDQARVQIDTRP